MEEKVASKQFNDYQNFSVLRLDDNQTWLRLVNFFYSQSSYFSAIKQNVSIF